MSRLRHDREFQRQLDRRQEEQPPDELIEWFRTGQAEGRLRDDVDALELGRFVTMVINGLALRVVSADETNVESVIRLLHDAVGPRQ
jgi:hypothetical protein